MEFSASIKIVQRGAKSKTPVWDLESDPKGDITFEDFVEEFRQVIIATAKEALKIEQIEGFDEKPVKVVDGKFNKAEEQVNPFGKIEYVARANIEELILYAYQAIQERTIIDTGFYSRSNLIFFKGQYLGATMSELKEFFRKGPVIEDKDVFRFVNTAPYARRLESGGHSRGRRAPKTKAVRNRRGAETKERSIVPNGAYALADKSIRAKYGRNAFIRFRYMSGKNMVLEGIPNTNPRTGKAFRRTFAGGKKKGDPYVYPTILISIVAAGGQIE